MKTELIVSLLIVSALAIGPAIAKGGGGGGGGGHGGGGGAHGSSGGGTGGGSTGSAGHGYGGGFGRGGGRGRYWGNPYDDQQNNQAPVSSSFQSYTFSGAPLIGPSGYSTYVQNYSWPKSQVADKTKQSPTNL
jgi:hypothetical protein